MTDHPYLPGEVEVLDALIDLYPNPAEDWTPQETDRRVVGALAAAKHFYLRHDRRESSVESHRVFQLAFEGYYNGVGTWVKLQQELGRSARYLKRYYERFPEKRGGC